jgi:transcriptional regulator with XRE-family HTH domain
MKARTKLARNLRRIRVEQGTSQEQLAADARVDRAYVGGLERETENPTIDLLDRLAEALDVEIADLLVKPLGRGPVAPLPRGRKPSSS